MSNLCKSSHMKMRKWHLFIFYIYLEYARFNENFANSQGLNLESFPKIQFLPKYIQVKKNDEKIRFYIFKCYCIFSQIFTHIPNQKQEIFGKHYKKKNVHFIFPCISSEEFQLNTEYCSQNITQFINNSHDIIRKLIKHFHNKDWMLE